MWNAGQDPKQSQVVGKLASAVLPAGPAGSASIDGTDAWTVTKSSKNPDKARELIEFYLDAAVQKRQVLDTGWLPIRLSVLADPEVQAKAPNAAVVLEQAKHPYDSFVTPDYNQVTVAVGTEVQKALQGQKTAAQAIADAHDQVAAIIKRRD
jgi:multiple sugar transport system substrate-binding protein